MLTDFEDYEKILKTKKDMDEALGVSVTIHWGEVMRIVVRDLISKRNACRDDELIEAFDKIILSYFLTEDEMNMALGLCKLKASDL